MKLKLIGKRQEAENITTFIFAPDPSADGFTWEAGQFMIYSLPHEKEDIRGRQRFFTISAAPFEKRPMISTRIFPKPSSFKKKLNNLKIGDEINAKGPDGDFVVDNIEQNSVFLAGGIGITPYRSIILDLDHQNKPMNITLLFSNKTSDFPFRRELDEAAEKNSSLRVHYLNKRVDENVIRELVPNVSDSIFYVSGPDAMVEEMLEVLKSLEIKEENIKSDYFSGYD